MKAQVLISEAFGIIASSKKPRSDRASMAREYFDGSVNGDGYNYPDGCLDSLSRLNYAVRNGILFRMDEARQVAGEENSESLTANRFDINLPGGGFNISSMTSVCADELGAIFDMVSGTRDDMITLINELRML